MVFSIYECKHISPNNQEMGQIISSIHTLWIASPIVARHSPTGVPQGITHILEDTMVNTLNKSPTKLYVHWGA